MFEWKEDMKQQIKLVGMAGNGQERASFELPKVREVVDYDANFALEKLMITKNTQKIDEMEKEMTALKALTSTLRRSELGSLPLEDQVAKYHDEIKPMSQELSDVQKRVEENMIDIDLLKMQQKETSEYLKEFHAHFTSQMAAIDASTIKDYSNAFSSLLEQIDAIKLQFVHLTSTMNGNRIVKG